MKDLFWLIASIGLLLAILAGVIFGIPMLVAWFLVNL